MRGVCITKGSMRNTVPDNTCSEGEWLKTGNGFEHTPGTHLWLEPLRGSQTSERMDSR